MNKFKDLERSERPEHAGGARNAPALPVVERLAQFARRLGVNRSTVTRAAQAGRLVLAADGRVLVGPSIERWAATRGVRDDVAQRHALARQAAGVAVPHAAVAAAATLGAADAAAPGDAATADAQGDVPGALRAQAESERLRWHNAALQLSLELTRGTRIPRRALRREAQALGNALRGALERLIDQTAPRLAAAAADPTEQRRLLRAELLVVRRQQQGEFGRAARRLRPDGTVAPLAGAAADAAADHP